VAVSHQPHNPAEGRGERFREVESYCLEVVPASQCLRELFCVWCWNGKGGKEERDLRLWLECMGEGDSMLCGGR